MLLARGAQLGGALGWRADPAVSALTQQARELGVEVRTRTLAFGVYDHNLVCACESLAPEGALDLPACVLRERLWKIRARSVIAAPGPFDRPLVFPATPPPCVILHTPSLKYPGPSA